MDIQKRPLRQFFAIGLWCWVFLAGLRASQDHCTVKIDNLIVQPLTGEQPGNILIRHLLSCEFRNDPAFVDEFGYPCLVCRWELGRQRWNRRPDASFDIIVLCPVRNSELFESWGKGFGRFGAG